MTNVISSAKSNFVMTHRLENNSLRCLATLA
jgi:hypothetical protein